VTSPQFPDLDEARRRFSALEDLVIHQAGGWADQDALRKARALLASARGALDDPGCSAVLAAIEPLLADLYSESGHQKWNHTQTSGRDFLRLRILRDLSGLDQRISEMALRRSRDGGNPGSDKLGPRLRGGDD
jgi:hypothetical protein